MQRCDQSQNVEKKGTELGRICDILGYLCSTDRLCVYFDIVRTTLYGPIYKGNGVRKTLSEIHCEKDVRKTL